MFRFLKTQYRLQQTEEKRAAYKEKLRSYCPKIITPEQYEEITGEKFENDSEVHEQGQRSRHYRECRSQRRI